MTCRLIIAKIDHSDLMFKQGGAIDAYFHVLAQKKQALAPPGIKKLLQYQLQMCCNRLLFLAIQANLL